MNQTLEKETNSPKNDVNSGTKSANQEDKNKKSDLLIIDGAFDSNKITFYQNEVNMEEISQSQTEISLLSLINNQRKKNNMDLLLDDQQNDPSEELKFKNDQTNLIKPNFTKHGSNSFPEKNNEIFHFGKKNPKNISEMMKTDSNSKTHSEREKLMLEQTLQDNQLLHQEFDSIYSEFIKKEQELAQEYLKSELEEENTMKLKLQAEKIKKERQIFINKLKNENTVNRLKVGQSELLSAELNTNIELLRQISGVLKRNREN